MLNIANGPRPEHNICTFPTPFPSHYLLPLKKHSNLQELEGAPVDMEPGSDRKVKLLQKQTVKPFSYYSLTTFPVYFNDM
jgi:hypothetical protein